jgi:hypothetical protein
MTEGGEMAIAFPGPLWDTECTRDTGVINRLACFPLWL